MFDWMYLVYGVIASVAIWPINRWCIKNGGDERTLGFWGTIIIAIFSILFLAVSGTDFLVTPIIISAGIVSLSYSIGFLIIIMRCLKIGPSGLTMTINNSAMIFGILYSILVLRPHIPGAFVIIGIVGVLFAITLIGLAKNNIHNKNYDYKKWYKLVIVGGLLSGVSFMNQAYMGYSHPGVMNTIIFLFWANFFAACILLITSIINKSVIISRKEIKAGAGNAFFNSTGLICTFASISIFGSEMTFPIVICLPIVIMLFVGRFVYHEKLDNFSLSGAVIALISIFLLTIG